METEGPEKLKLEILSSLKGQSFRVLLTGGATVDLVLTEVAEIPDGARTLRNLEIRPKPFRLEFRGASRLGQSTYRLANENLGEVEIFIVPIGVLAGSEYRYEAIFN